MDNKINVSENVRLLKVNKDTYLIWNRFFPSVLKINQSGLDFIENLRRKKKYSGNDEEDKPHIESLLKYRILYKGDSEHAEESLFKSYNRLLSKIEANAIKFYNENIPYSRLCIVFDICNLKCSYCIRSHKNPYTPKNIKPQEKYKYLNMIVDQFFSRIRNNGIKDTKISFNGGEILLEWNLMKKMINRISKKYPGIYVTYTINTNMTLMSEEIAKFFNDYQFQVYISIDGYKEAHNKTRKYHNGVGSFDDVIRGLDIFRKYNMNFKINGFQGTIEHIDDFDPTEIFKMRKYGFEEARLTPNLLNIPIISAKKKARMFGKIIDLNLNEKLKVDDIYFRNMVKIINNDNFILYANCKGLSAYPLKIVVNIDTLRLSQICDYINLASVPYEELDYNIYNPKLWDYSYYFIKSRSQELFKNCINCDVLGICRGGCIYTGLDKENKVNSAACAYQRELWKVFLKRVFQHGENNQKEKNHA